MNLSMNLALLLVGLQAATPANVCTLLGNRRYLVIDVRPTSVAGTDTARICGSYETQNVPLSTLTSSNVEATLLRLKSRVDNTAWTPAGQFLGVSKDKTRRFVSPGANGVTAGTTSTTGTPILVYGATVQEATTAYNLINAVGFLGNVTNIGDYSTINARSCACPKRTCALLADANYKILDTRVDSPGSSVRGFAASTLLCPRTANLNRRNPWTVAQVEAAVGSVKTQPILTLCYRGNWAEDARQELIARGYTNVINIGGYQAISELKCRTVGSVQQRGVTCPSSVFRCLRTYVPTHAEYKPNECTGDDAFVSKEKATSAAVTGFASVALMVMFVFTSLL